MPRISSEPLTGWALLIERLYRLTHHGQIRTLVIRRRDGWAPGWPEHVPLDLGPGAWPLGPLAPRGLGLGPGDPLATVTADQWLRGIRTLFPPPGLSFGELGPDVVDVGPEHLSLWCRVNNTAGVAHHRCSGTCDKNHGGAGARLALYPDPPTCGQPCQCEDHGTPCGSAPGADW